MTRVTRVILCALSLAVVSACSTQNTGQLGRPHQLSQIEADLHAHVAVLASDEFGGRRPGTEGEWLTLNYLNDQFAEAGLQSGTNDPANLWFAPVDLQQKTPLSSLAKFRKYGRNIPLESDAVRLFTTGRRALLEEAPMIFVGGRGANLHRSELAGRVAVMLWDQAEGFAQRDALHENGAAAVLAIIKDSAEFDQLDNIRSKGSYRLADDTGAAMLDGYLREEAARKIIGAARLDRLIASARYSDFKPVPLNVKATLEAESTSSQVRTHNLIAKLPGRRPEKGAVLLMAHWDHFGHCGEAKLGNPQDLICNGAVDNASGLAVLIELAQKLKKQTRPDRDIYFLATTAEEWGLLGAHAFTRDPPLPLERIVAAFNVDAIGVTGRGGDIAIVGQGMTQLDQHIAEIAARYGKNVEDGVFAAEFLKRQDGWALLQNDVPALMVSSAYASPAAMRHFTQTRYHRANDEIETINLGGAAEDMLLHLEFVRFFGDRDKFPSE